MAGDLITTADLAARLKVSPRTVQQWRRKGWITPEVVTPGGMSRWVEADVRTQLRELNERRQREHDAE